MTDKRIDGWYRASGRRATFAFRVEGGEVVEVAPYGRKIIKGLTWAAAQMKLDLGGFEIVRLEGNFHINPPTNERAERFLDLLSEIEIAARKLLDGRARDIPWAVTDMLHNVTEARDIAYGVSREALDRVIEIHPLSPDADEP